MKIIYSERAWNSASFGVLIERIKRVHEYLVGSQMKQPVIKWFVFSSVHHYNSNWEQNQYHIRNQRKNCIESVSFGKIIFLRKIGLWSPSAVFFSKIPSWSPTGRFCLRNFFLQKLFEAMQFFTLISNMILILFSIRIIMMHRAKYEPFYHRLFHLWFHQIFMDSFYSFD